MKAIVIHILKERCKGCGVCVEICQTRVLTLSEELNEAGFPYPVAEHTERCLLCGMCEMFCPDFAIWAAIDREEAQK
jgi:2-oxoglutarate ferredoxin oxidoreductase subunit delta